MAELRLSEEAASDLDGIRNDGIARFGQPVADRHLGSIRQAIALLAEHPFMGQERPELSGGIRSIARRPHRILYTAADDLVRIVRMLHQARDVGTALGELQ